MRKSLFKTWLFAGLNLIWGRGLSSGASILMYHSVGRDEAFFTVRPEQFERQLSFLSRERRVVRLSELLRRLTLGQSVAGLVVLTFDDAYSDNYEKVFPLIKKYQLPITVFVPTGLVGKSLVGSQGLALPLLQQNEIIEMFGSGLVEFMPHGHRHLELDSLETSVWQEELVLSLEGLRTLVSSVLPVLAYPRGKWTREIADYLRAHAWQGGLTVREGLVTEESDLYLLPRNSVDSATSFSQFRGKISDSLVYYLKLRKWLRF